MLQNFLQIGVMMPHTLDNKKKASSLEQGDLPNVSSPRCQPMCYTFICRLSSDVVPV